MTDTSNLPTRYRLTSQIGELQVSIDYLQAHVDDEDDKDVPYIRSEAQRNEAHEALKSMRAELKSLQAAFAQGLFVEEHNARGNMVLRDDEADFALSLVAGRSRYFYDARLVPFGWKQYDTAQDANYFGVWVNLDTRQIFTYAEGDRCLVTCPTAESFQAELADAERFYGPAPAAFTVFDLAAGTRTEVFTPRPQLMA